MATKLIVLCLMFSAFQCGCALEQRGIVGDFINATITNVVVPFQKKVAESLSTIETLAKNATAKAQETFKNVENQVVSVWNNIQSGIKAKVQEAQQLGKNVTSCASLAFQKGQNALNSTRTSVQACTTTAIQPVRDLQKDRQDLAKQVGQLIFDLPGQAINCFSKGFLGMFSCEGELAQNVTSRVSMLGAALGADSLKIGGMLVPLSISIAKCEGDGISNAVTQLTAIQTQAFSCIKNGPTA